MEHILLKKAFIFENENKNLDPAGSTYNALLGAWTKEEDGKEVILVHSDDPDKPETGTKKADVETGEDQKGM